MLLLKQSKDVIKKQGKKRNMKCSRINGMCFEPCNLQRVRTGHNNDVTERRSCTVSKTL